MHGALPIQSGERINLIIWMRSSVVRNKLCPMCGMEPRLMPCSGEGDGFTTSLFSPLSKARGKARRDPEQVKRKQLDSFP